MKTLRLLVALSFVLLAGSGAVLAEEVTFYPAYGFRQGNVWSIPLRVWVHEPRGVPGPLVSTLADRIGQHGSSELDVFKSRLAAFVANDKSLERVVFKFDGDDEQFRMKGADGDFHRTDTNGLVEGTVTLSEERARDLLRKQNSQGGWLTLRAVSTGHVGVGRVRLIGPEGLSIVSDIDDTIKITELPAGETVVLRNTFFRPFAAAPEMATQYREFGDDAAFHYVSGGPWQLYKPLSDFLITPGPGGFPEGSFHMRSFRKNLLSLDTWRDLKELLSGGPGSQDATFRHKVEAITKLMRTFEGREFILIGDSGEKDPEVYRRVKETFGARVREIRIRDVTNDRELRPERLSGMTIIPATTVVRNSSQFDR